MSRITQFVAAIAGVAVWASLAVSHCRAHDMGGNFNITNGAQVWSLDSGATTVTGSGYVWTFPDAGGVNMAGFNVMNTNDSNGFTLNMSGGSITGGGMLSTSRSNHTGAITVTNVSSMTVRGITAYGMSSAAFNSSNIIVTGTGAGAFTVPTGGVNAACGGSSGSYGGNVFISRFTSVSITGSVQSYGQYFFRHGSISIGAAGSPIGGNISVAGDLISGNTNFGGANVSLYANGPVSVGNISMSSASSWGNPMSPGNLTVSNRGAFVCGNVIARSSGSGGTPCQAMFDGGDTSGAFTVNGKIDLSVGYNGAPDSAGISRLTISNYTAVTITGMVNTTWGDYAVFANEPAGNVTVGGISGDVVIGDIIATNARAGYAGGNVSIATAGNIVLNSANLDGSGGQNTNVYDGTLTLTANGGSSKITLAGLDLGKVKNATMSAGGGKTFIRGPLLNFPVSLATNGLLDASAGQRILVDSAVTNNSYLTNGYSGKFTLKSGGTLSYGIPGNGTVITLK